MVRLLSGDFLGLEGRPVEVQVDVSTRGSPGFIIVGLPGKSIRESRERIRTAIRNSRLNFPHKDRILVNLAPAAEQKEGSGFDLAIALGILLASRQLPPVEGRIGPEGLLAGIGFIGELGLNGEMRPVPGALLASDALCRHGVEAMVVSPSNARETALVEGIKVFPARSLEEAIRVLEGNVAPYEKPAAGREDDGDDFATASLEARQASADGAGGRSAGDVPDFRDVKGQETTKRGLLISAAGGHNVLLVGPPGVGKTMLARRLPGILPVMRYEEAMEVTRIRSALGQVLRERLVEVRPFRAPHHTISYAGLVGGGSRLRPGEVTRAHHGVLFLDELPEFQRRALEALREPLEEGAISIGRSAGAVVYPARFLLIAAMNPCPCGYLGHERRPCSCTSFEIRSYRQRLSGPLLDRLDLFLEVNPVKPAEMLEDTAIQKRMPSPGGLDTSLLHEEVTQARARQARRWGVGQMNSRVPFPRFLAQGKFRPQALLELQRSADGLALSARGFSRCLRVARSIADLEVSPWVEVNHVLEAIHYRETVLSGSP